MTIYRFTCQTYCLCAQYNRGMRSLNELTVSGSAVSDNIHVLSSRYGTMSGKKIREVNSRVGELNGNAPRIC